MRLPLFPLAFFFALAFLLAPAALPAFAQAGPVGGAGPPSGPPARPPSNAKSGPVYGDSQDNDEAYKGFQSFETIHTMPKPVPTRILTSPVAKPPTKTVQPKKHVPAKKPAIPPARRHHMKATMKAMRFVSLYSTTHTLPKPKTDGARKPTRP